MWILEILSEMSDGIVQMEDSAIRGSYICIEVRLVSLMSQTPSTLINASPP
jgi:hypothetical protein